MRLTKHIAEDFDLNNNAQRPAVSFSPNRAKVKEKSRTPAPSTLRALLKLLKFRWQ